MKKILTITFIITTIFLGGCARKQPQLNSLIEEQGIEQTMPIPKATQEKESKQTTTTPGVIQENKIVDFTTNYLPPKWVIEDDTFYSPEMYNAREGGPYSLHITVNNKFSSIKDYLENKASCINNKIDYNINDNPAVKFTDTCEYYKPKITLLQIDKNLIEAFSYSFSDESREIEKILKTLEIKK